jgi:hypothetical protein
MSATTNTLKRVAFTTSRALEFFTESELTTQIGYRKELWPLVLTKELIDNAIDACETAATEQIEIGVQLDRDSITVSDNGPGIPRKVIKGVIDYRVRISDKKYYVTPTRGQLGNALKCVVAAPFVATGEASVIEITSRGMRHTIRIELDRIAQEPRITWTDAKVPQAIGTILKVCWSEIARYFSTNYGDLYQFADLDLAVSALLDSFSAFNPHVSFTFNGERRAATNPAWRKWRTDAPPSAHWYRAGDLRALIAAHISDGSDLLVRDFVADFDGFARSRARADVMTAAKLERAHLSDLKHNGDVDAKVVERLLAAMRAHSRPVIPNRLGVIGKDHLERYFDSLGAKGFKYWKKTSIDDEGLPVVFETAFGVMSNAAAGSKRVLGLNWSPIFKLPSGEIGEAISSQHVSQSDPVILLIHAARPRFDFTDHGKGSIS